MSTGAKTVFIVGYYGFGNTGDEAILAGMLADLRRRVPALLAVVATGDPAGTAAFHDVPVVEWRDPLAVHDAVRAADLVIVGGGGIFHDWWGLEPAAIFSREHGGISYYAEPALLAALEGRPLMLYAVGIGPLFSAPARELVRAAAEAADVVTVRDASSRDRLVEAGIQAERVEVTADPAFLVAPAPPGVSAELVGTGAPAGEGPLVGAALRSWGEGVRPEVWQGEVARGLDLAVERLGIRVLLVPFQRLSGVLEDDVAVAEAVRARMRHAERTAIFPRALAPADTAALLAACDAVVAMRLHALILGTLCGRPAVSLVYDPKVAHHVRMLGVEDLALPIGEVRAEPLAARIERALAGGRGGQIQAAIHRHALRLSALAARNGELAAHLLMSPAKSQPGLTPAQAVIVGRALRANAVRAARLESEVTARGEEATHRAQELKAMESRYEQESELQRQREQQLLQEIFRLQTEQVRWKQSRLWRVANVYWRGRRFLRRLLGRPPVASPPMRSSDREAGSQVPMDRAPPARDNAFDVICFPSIPWDFRFQRPQQLMARLGKQGYRVFYIAQSLPPSGSPYELRRVGENVYETSLRGLHRDVYRETLDERELEDLSSALGSLRRDMGLAAAAAVVQLPFWWPLARWAGERWGWPVVYDCMDDHRGFHREYLSALVAIEEEMLREARLVLTTSHKLRVNAERHRRNVILLPNACDYEHFAGVAVRKPNEPPVVGFFGAIAEWFDTHLLAELASRRPEWRFIMVGSTYGADLAPVGKLGNFELAGEQPYSSLPCWLERMDVLVIPFMRTALTEATNPVKVYEILAAGKPLVSVPWIDLATAGGLVRLAESAPEFEAQILAALEEEREAGSALVEKRRAFAREETWARRGALLEGELERTFPKASVVIVTYDNLALSWLCLESVFERTAWPNLEVIVVDNGSADGTPHYLAEEEKRRSNLRVILNPENRGFAAASNQGLEQASGDYFVLLSNDTVVTRGWLATLIRRLRADPTIGLVGPVTNAIGNEAQIEVGYAGLEDMPAWAANYVRNHDGESFDIPGLAMFCLALRREVFERIGPLDEAFQVGRFEEDDYAKRVRATGLRVACAEDSFVHHWGRAAGQARLGPGRPRRRSPELAKMTPQLVERAGSGWRS